MIRIDDLIAQSCKPATKLSCCAKSLVMLREVAASKKILETTMKDKQAFVYMLASQRNGTLYTGVTSGLLKRIYEHKT